MLYKYFQILITNNLNIVKQKTFKKLTQIYFKCCTNRSQVGECRRLRELQWLHYHKPPSLRAAFALFLLLLIIIIFILANVIVIIVISQTLPFPLLSPSSTPSTNHL